MANDMVHRDDEGPMAKMPVPDNERKAIAIIGAFQGLRTGATFLRGATAGLLLRICEQRLWRDGGFASQAAFLEFHKIDRRELSDLKQELSAFGEELMTRMDEAGVPRKARRVLTHVDRKDLIEIRKQLEATPDADALHDLAADLYNRIAEAEKDKTAATENAQNWKAKAEEASAAKKDVEKKARRLEEELDAALQGLPRNRAYRELYTRAFRALTNLKMHVRTEGLLADDEKLFQGNVDVLNDLITEIWSIHTGKPMIGEPREKYVRRLMKEQGLSREDAEKGVDLTKDGQ